MRIGEVRTSIKLEPEFWSYLKEVAQARSIRLSRLVNEVAMVEKKDVKNNTNPIYPGTPGHFTCTP